MKKNIAVALFLVSFLLSEGVIAFAADGDVFGNCKQPGDTCNSASLSCQNGKCLPQEGSGPKTLTEIFATLDGVINWVFAFVILLSVMFVILAAFEFVTGGPEGVAKARQKLIWAAVGIGIAMLAKAVPTVIANFLGVS